MNNKHSFTYEIVKLCPLSYRIFISIVISIGISIDYRYCPVNDIDALLLDHESFLFSISSYFVSPFFVEREEKDNHSLKLNERGGTLFVLTVFYFSLYEI